MTLIAIAFLILIAIVFLTLFLFRSINIKSFKAEDGTYFDNKADLELYQNLYDKTKPLFEADLNKAPDQQIMGFERLFLSKLTVEGFPDLKSIIKFRKQFKILSDLLNT